MADTGCTVCTIPYEMIKNMGFQKADIRRLRVATTLANGWKVKSIGVILLDVKYENSSARMHFLVYRSFPFCLLSKECCENLSLIPKGFPLTQLTQTDKFQI